MKLQTRRVYILGQNEERSRLRCDTSLDVEDMAVKLNEERMASWFFEI